MSFRLLAISTMYEGYLDSFYAIHPEIAGMTYSEHHKILMDETTEFAGSYLRNFRKSGIEADCIVCNDSELQKKWSIEKGLDPDNKPGIILDQIKSFMPEVLWVENLSCVTSEFLRNARIQVPSIRLIAANHGSPFNSKVIESMKGVDFVITCTPGLKSAIGEMGKKSFLVYHGFDTDQLKWLNTESSLPGNDFIFSGSLITGGDFHARRIHLIEELVKEDIPVELYVNLESKFRIRAKQSIYYLNSFLKKTGLSNSLGRFPVLQYGKTRVNSYSDKLLGKIKPPVYGPDMLNLFHNSKIVLNFHIGIAGDWAGNMRMFEVTGVGSCLLTDNKKNMSELFDIEKEVVVYENEHDCAEKVRWLLDHEDERKQIAISGQKRTLNSHTVENRCRSIIGIMNSELMSR
jgi:spore maturation protein CgeB